MPRIEITPTAGEQNLTMHEAITAITMEFTDTVGDQTPNCYDCNKPFMSTFKESSQENQAYVRNGYMQVCSCGGRGAYLTPKE